MELALALRSLWRSRIWLLPVAVVAIVASIAVTCTASILPPELKLRGSFEYGAATARVLLDSSESSLAQLDTPISAISERAGLYASLLETEPVRRRMGELARTPWQGINVSGQTEAPGEPGAAERSSQLVSEGRETTVFYSVAPGQPTIDLYTQAPTAMQARRLASSAVKSLQEYVSGLERRRRIPPGRRVEFEQLGAAQAGVLAAGSGVLVGLLVGLFVFGLGCLAIVLVPRLVLDLRKATVAEQQALRVAGVAAQPAEHAKLGNGTGPALDPAQGDAERG